MARACLGSPRHFTQGADLFFFFSNRIGCAASIAITVAGSIVLLVLLGGFAAR
jgi:hypothetical protein